MTFTAALPNAPTPPAPSKRRRTFHRRWQFWTVAGFMLVLAAGWPLAIYNDGASRHNSAAVGQLRDTNAELNRQLDATKTHLGNVMSERDQLLAGRAEAEAAVQTREDAAKKREDDLVAREAAAKKREDDVKAREDAVTQQEKVQAQHTITEGSWAVGVDVQPGTYRTKEPVGDSCYWAIYSDANGRNIVANDFISGGRPTVTLKNGQYFTSDRCGEWIKV